MPHVRDLIHLSHNQLKAILGECTDFNSNSFAENQSPISASIKVESLEPFDRVAALRSHQNLVTDFAWSPDGRFLISGSMDGTAIIWEVLKGVPLIRLGKGYDCFKSFVQSVAWNSVYSYVAILTGINHLFIYEIDILSNKEELAFWIIPGCEERLDVTLFSKPIKKTTSRKLSFSPDGNFLVVPGSFIYINPFNIEHIGVFK